MSHEDVQCLGALAGVLVVPELLRAASEAQKAFSDTADPRLRKLVDALRDYDDSVGLAVEIILAPPTTRRRLRKLLAEVRQKRGKRIQAPFVHSQEELAAICRGRSISVRSMQKRGCCVLSDGDRPLAAVKTADLLAWAMA